MMNSQVALRADNIYKITARKDHFNPPSIEKDPLEEQRTAQLALTVAKSVCQGSVRVLSSMDSSDKLVISGEFGKEAYDLYQYQLPPEQKKQYYDQLERRVTFELTA